MYSTNRILVVKATFPTNEKHKVMRSAGFVGKTKELSC